jgi:drug/metabolite transporter (DMT)-like permease
MITQNYKHKTMVFSQSYLKLHRIIFLNSLIPIILILISLNPYEILFFRTLSAVVLLQAWFMLKKIKFAAERKSKIKLAASGILVFCFWGLSFLCVKASTASVYLVSLSTTPLWVSLIQYFENTRQHRPFQFLTSLNAVMGIYIIFNSDFEYGLGMALGISAAFFGAMLTVVSSYFSKNYPAIFVTYYQMSGSFASCLIFLPIYIYILDAPFDFTPSAKDM